MVGSELTFAERGRHGLKGVPGVWALFAARKEGEPAAAGAPGAAGGVAP